MKDSPIAVLETALETDLLAQVLRDRGIPFRIELSEETWLGIYLGANSVRDWCGFGRVWGFEQDAAAIEQALAEVRASKPVPADVAWQGSRKWRVKKP